MFSNHKLAVSLLFSGLLAASFSASAHHAFAAEYDADKPISLNGKLTKVEWINPHGYVHVDIKDKAGKTADWLIEFGAPNSLLRKGFRKTDFPVGSDVVVKGYQAKNGANVAAASTVVLPDGRSFYAGSEGTGAPGDPGAYKPGN
jgi:hypothetical protein